MNCNTNGLQLWPFCKGKGCCYRNFQVFPVKDVNPKEERTAAPGDGGSGVKNKHTLLHLGHGHVKLPHILNSKLLPLWLQFVVKGTNIHIIFSKLGVFAFPSPTDLFGLKFGNEVVYNQRQPVSFEKVTCKTVPG